VAIRTEEQREAPRTFGRWLITGGAGYIGSHIAEEFSRLELPFAIVDNNEIKLKNRLPSNVIKFLGDIRNTKDLEIIFDNNEFTGVIHLAALKSVEESQKNPKMYEETNVDGTRNLLNIMRKKGVKNLVFSSTAAVYGETDTGVVTEATKIDPISYYGKTKVLSELLIEEAGNDFGLNFVNLRYFNVAGALNKKLQDDSNDNLIPIVIDKIEKGVSPTIFGSDYPTHDGTAIRDYIHIVDVVGAHLASVDYLSKGGASQTLNIGTGIGTSVLEIVSEILLQKRSELIPNFIGRREGDIGIVVADPSKAEEVLGFKARHTLTEMVVSVL
jgi:UDP-glucose 4-epimerase